MVAMLPVPVMDIFNCFALKGSDTVFFLTVSAEAINVVYLNNA
jgi:hypothetical protein